MRPYASENTLKIMFYNNIIKKKKILEILNWYLTQFLRYGGDSRNMTHSLNDVHWYTAEKSVGFDFIFFISLQHYRFLFLLKGRRNHENVKGRFKWELK